MINCLEFLDDPRFFYAAEADELDPPCFEFFGIEKEGG